MSEEYINEEKNIKIYLSKKQWNLLEEMSKKTKQGIGELLSEMIDSCMMEWFDPYL